MAEKKKGQSSSRPSGRGAAASGRGTAKKKAPKSSKSGSSGGFGDDQGTRVGAPRRSGRARSGPSTEPEDQGLEGSILDED